MYSFKEYSELDEAVLDQKIRAPGPYRGMPLGSKKVPVDGHLAAMTFHSNEYQKAMKVNDTSLAQLHGHMYHAHKDQIERMGGQGDYKKD